MKKVIALFLCYLLTTNTTTHTMMQPWQRHETSDELQQDQSANAKPISSSSDVLRNTANTKMPETNQLSTVLLNPRTLQQQAEKPLSTKAQHKIDGQVLELSKKQQKIILDLINPSLIQQLSNNMFVSPANRLAIHNSIANRLTNQDIMMGACAYMCLTSILSLGSATAIHAVPFLTCLLLGYDYCPDLAPARQLSFEAAPLTALFSLFLMHKMMKKVYSNKKTNFSL